MWNKPVATVYVRESRYTHDFMDNEGYFTVSFYSADYKNVLVVLGSKSGRDIDRINNSGLTPKVAGKSVSFEEAAVTLVCKKLFKQRVDIDKIPEDIANTLYASGDAHTMYIGESRYCYKERE